MAKFQESMPPFDTNKTDFFGEKLQLKPMDSVHIYSAALKFCLRLVSR